MLSKETEEKVLELDSRMMKAFSEGLVYGGGGMEDKREAFLPEDFGILHQASKELGSTAQTLIRICESVAKQLARGERCAVCGMTIAQAKEANYDCTYEC